MFKNFFQDGASSVLRFFPERQVYLRSGGEVSYHTVSTRVQISIAASAILILIWCAITFANLAVGNNPLRTPQEKSRQLEADFQRQLDDMEAKYDLAQLQLSEQQETFERAAKSFQEKHAILAQFVSNPPIEDVIIAGVDIHQSKGQVLMAPIAREMVQRQARSDRFQVAELRTGTSLDAPMSDLNRDLTYSLLMAENQNFSKIERNRAIIETTKIDINTLLSSGLSGTGGPLIPANDVEFGEEKADPRLTQMQARAEEARRLEAAIDSIPLGHPVAVDHYRTSSFGMRTDPFTKRPARHHAVDFASYKNAPIVATAAGTVKSVTVSRGGYGRMVEIDHGYGFTTRYAHLSKSFVKRGQKVAAGDKIGGMGSTGRSTSTHLHYEVRFQGRAQNPDNFLKAGRYVHQN